LVRLEREDAVPVPDSDNAAVVLGFGEFLVQEPTPEAPELVAMEIADKRVHELRWSVRRWVHTVAR
jgi:hypothetical protein